MLLLDVAVVVVVGEGVEVDDDENTDDAPTSVCRWRFGFCCLQDDDGDDDVGFGSDDDDDDGRWMVCNFPGRRTKSFLLPAGLRKDDDDDDEGEGPDEVFF